jgi:hypothetical protein
VTQFPPTAFHPCQSVFTRGRIHPWPYSPVASAHHHPQPQAGNEETIHQQKPPPETRIPSSRPILVLELLPEQRSQSVAPLAPNGGTVSGVRGQSSPKTQTAHHPASHSAASRDTIPPLRFIRANPCSSVAVFIRGRVHPWPCSPVAVLTRSRAHPWHPRTTIHNRKPETKRQSTSKSRLRKHAFPAVAPFSFSNSCPNSVHNLWHPSHPTGERGRG